MISTSKTISALPTVVHGPRVSRLTDAELVRWESTLEVADSAVAACMAARAVATPPADDKTALSALKAVVSTIRALTGCDEPTTLTSQRAMIAWTCGALGRMQPAPTPAHTPRASPEHAATVMELMARLNDSLRRD